MNNNIEQLLQQIIESQNKTNERLDNIEKKLGNNRLERIEKKLDDVYNQTTVIYDQTAILTEFRTEANAKLDNISHKINAVEAVTKENLYDIAKLKLIR